MSTEYLVLIPALRTAATAAQDAADQISAIDLAAPLDEEVELALPGSRAAELASALSAAFRKRIADWSAASAHYAERVSACANTYEEVDRDRAGAFDRVIRPDAMRGGSPTW